MTTTALGNLGDQMPLSGRPDYDRLQDLLARARKEQPVFYWAGLDVWVVTKQVDVLTVLRDTDSFSSEGILGMVTRRPEAAQMLVDAGVPDHVRTRWLGIVDGEMHGLMKAALKATFTPRRVEALEPRMRELAKGYMDTFPTDKPFDFVADYAYPFPLSVILALIGLEIDDAQQVKHWTDQLITWITAIEMDPAAELTCAQDLIDMNIYVGEVLADRRDNPGEDFLSALIQEAQNDPDTLWGDDELRHFIAHGLLLAGHETTKAVMSGGLWRLLQEPGALRQLADDKSLCLTTTEEALRHDPPLSGFFRIVKREVEIGGQTLPVDARVMFSIASANNDEERYTCPRQFQIDRTGEEQFHVTFGHGLHYCLGAPLARLELRVTYQMLAERFPNLRLALDREPEYVPNPILMHLSGLWLETGA